MNHESWHIYSSLLNSTRSTIHQEIYWMYCRSLLKGIAPQMNPHQQLVKQFIMIRNRLDAIADGDQHQEPLQAAGTGFAWTGRGEIGWRFLQCGWNQRSVYRSLPGLLMGFVLTGSQRGCSDSANCCARRRQHVFRQPKAASSIMQCYRRVWRVMSCYMYIYIYLNLFSFVLCGVTFPWDDILELHLYAEELPLLMARTGQIRFWRKQNCRNTRLVAWVCLLKFSWNPKPWYFLYNWMYRTRIAA